jgi:hypothetical protein
MRCARCGSTAQEVRLGEADGLVRAAASSTAASGGPASQPGRSGAGRAPRPSAWITAPHRNLKPHTVSACFAVSACICLREGAGGGALACAHASTMCRFFQTLCTFLRYSGSLRLGVRTRRVERGLPAGESESAWIPLHLRASAVRVRLRPGGGCSAARRHGLGRPAARRPGGPASGRRPERT